MSPAALSAGRRISGIEEGVYRRLGERPCEEVLGRTLAAGIFPWVGHPGGETNVRTIADALWANS
jgi:hypothetical protein